MATKRRIAFSAVERPADFGVGKWSRIATYGLKAQRQPDGSFAQTLFDDEKFGQWLKNFRLMFASRGKGMGSDYEHQTMHAAKNGQPAQNLAYFTALAWVRNGSLQALRRCAMALRLSTQAQNVPGLPLRTPKRTAHQTASGRTAPR